jgi:hypothetical protein
MVTGHWNNLSSLISETEGCENRTALTFSFERLRGRPILSGFRQLAFLDFLHPWVVAEWAATN